MKRSVKIVAWLCIFSIHYMGCYSSTMVDPAGADKEKVDPDWIYNVVTKDSTKYAFDYPAKIVKDSVVGDVVGEQVSIPLSDVALVSGDEFNHDKTVSFVVATVVSILLLTVVLYAQSVKNR
jgi:hypothetical protein